MTGGEIHRILALPEVYYDGIPGSIGADWKRHPDAPDLLPDQAAFLVACAHAASVEGSEQSGAPGVLGFMSCGSGKTLALQLAPWCFNVPRDRVLLLTKASLKEQTLRDTALWSRHYNLASPRMMSYGKLSHPSGSKVLEEMEPLLILADEVHELGQGGRARRLWRYLAKNRHVRFVGVSGSLMDTKVARTAEIAMLALRDWCPFPFTDGVLEHWSSVLDAGGEFSDVDYGALVPLISRHRHSTDGHGSTDDKPVDVARRAVRARLQSCPGVVVTRGALGVGAALTVALARPEVGDDYYRLVRDWALPDGTMLVDMLEFWRHERTVRLGFFYRFDPETVHEEWTAARRAWMGEVNAHIEYAGFDTPYFVAQAARGRALRPGTLAVWDRWCAVREKFSPPTRETVWVDGGRERLKAFVNEWWSVSDASSRDVFWYHSKAIEEWATETYGASGVHAASDSPPTRGPAFVSLAHRTGWNAESGSTAFSRALVLEPPTTPKMIEQLLSRHHRRGQTADEVHFTLCCDGKDFYALRNRVEAVHDLTGSPQRLILANRVEAPV